MTHNTSASTNSHYRDNNHLTDIDDLMASSLEMITRAYELLRSPNPDAITELRILNTLRSGTVSGYFTDVNKFVVNANSYSGRAPGVYCTLNPVHPDLLARANNRVVERAKHTTSDSDITSRIWLPIDLDPVRPSGISASDDEHEATLSLGQELQEWLQELGWPPAVFADSGNGAHILYRIELPNDEESTKLLKRCLEALDVRFSNDEVKVDLTTFNAARIWKVYGTKACKGDELSDRRHRMAKLIDAPESLSVVSLEQLERLAAMTPEASNPTPQPRRSGKHAVFDLERWIEEHNLPIASTKPWNSGQMWILNPCPWNTDHTNASAYLIHHANGAITAGCHHNSCADKDWHALRDVYEPDWRTNRYRTSHGGQKNAALDAVIDELIATVKEDRDPKHVFDAVDDLAYLSSAAFGKVKAELKDILRDKLNLNDLERAVNEVRQQLDSSTLPELGDDGLPSIQVNDRPLRDTTAEAIEALALANDPHQLFVRGGALTRVRTDEKSRLLIETLNEDHIRGFLSRSANTVRVMGDNTYHISPPRDVVRDILTSGSYPMFPALEGVVSSPILRPDGTILQQPGYDPDTRLIYLPPPGFVLPPMPERPSMEESHQAAMHILQELFGDFPFALDAPDGQGSASQTHALALLLSCILRPLVDGPVPLSIISAPQRGSGKTLLAEIVGLVATGQQVAVTSAPWSDEEWRKRISSTLADGDSVAIIDNVATTLTSPSLAAMLTAVMWKDRLLGRNDQSLTLPVRTIWIATANNPIVDTDFARRSFLIQLDAKLSRPWEGRTFRHENILDWSSQNRGQLLADLLTVARAWFVAGQPSAEAPTLGKFEAWSRILSGVLAFAQIPNFLGNLQELHEHMDPDAQQWEAFLTVWWRSYGETPVTVATLVDRIQQSSDLKETLPDYLSDAIDGGGGNFRKRLGNAFRKHKGVRYGDAGLYLESAGKDSRKNVMQWKVVCGFPGLPGFQAPNVKNSQPPAIGGFWEKRAEKNPQNPSNPSVDAQKIPTHHKDQDATEDETDEADPEGWVLPQSSLPTDVFEWPTDWRLLYNEFEDDFIVEHGLDLLEAQHRAEEKTRQLYLEELVAPPVIIPRAEADTLGQLAAELRLDLEDLSGRLGIPLCPPSIADAELLWQQLTHVNPKPVEGLRPEELSSLDIYLYRFIETFLSQQSRQNAQRLEAFRQQPERYGQLDIGATFQDVEYVAFDHGLDLLELSKQFGMNLCNLTLDEVRDLRRRMSDIWDETLAYRAYMSDFECKGLEQFLLQYEQAYERQTHMQKRVKQPCSTSRKQRRR